MTDAVGSDEVSDTRKSDHQPSKPPENASDQLDEPDAETADYLGSFNIDMGTSAGETDAPHYIINLNVFNPDDVTPSGGSDVVGLATLPVGGPFPSTSSTTPHAQALDSAGKPLDPTPPVLQPYLRPMGRPRGRARTRNSIPLDDVMEKKIRTFEGVDCVQHLEELQKLFPRFKRAYINRIFTRNMLNFDKTFQTLNEENNRYIAKVASVRLVPPNKPDSKQAESKTPKQEATCLNPRGYLYLDVPLGRCPPSIASTLYRRVIVKPDGSVESADDHEKRYLDATGQRVVRPPLKPPPTPPQQQTNSPEPLIPTPLQAVNSHSQPSSTLNSASKTVPPSQLSDLSGTMEPKTSTNRFFRSNRINEAESKKRGYVDRELRTAKAAATTRRSRGSTQKDANGTTGTTTPDSKDGDAAVKYMASVGVVSTPTSKKRATPKNDVKSVPQKVEQQQSTEEPVNDDLNLNKEERINVLEFFNDARPEELALMPGCSRKTAQILVSLRPFRNMTNLLNRLQGTRFLSPNLIDACKDVLQMRATVIRLLQRCERITERVADHVSNLLANVVSLSEDQLKSPKPSSDSGANAEHLLTQQPAILNPLLELKPYQLVGLNWLRLLHHEQVNGILADEMGLGKTIQAIAFLASLWENGDRGPHLIICPSSTQENWLRELSDWCSHLKVLVYQGSAEQRKAIRLKIYEAGTHPDFNILLTSYAIGTSTIEDRALMKRVNFHYGIFDEAHMLKNMSSQRYRHLSNFRVQRRLLLTGTPLQNNLLELVSLLSFLMPDLFARSTDLLKRMFQVYSKSVSERDENQLCDLDVCERSNFEVERLEQAKNLLQPFFLRRLKSQVLDQLPTKTNEVVKVKMTESQSKHYWKLVDRFRQATDTHVPVENTDSTHHVKLEEPGNENQEPDAEGVPSKRPRVETAVLNGTDSATLDTNLSVDSPSNMIVQLRKAANHQALLSGIAFSQASLRDIAETLHLDPSHANSDPQLIYEDLSVLSDHQVHKICQFYDILSSYTMPIETIMSGSGKLTWLDAQIPKMIEAGHRLLIFSQFVIVLDLLEEFLRYRDLRYLRLDGSTPVNERQHLVDRFNSSSIEVFLLSTRAGGLGLNLTGADVVIIHDIDFNPYNDKQAEDRVHRLGQTRPVHVIRLIAEGTVEEGILRIASEKLQLEQDVTGYTKPEADDQEAEPEETNHEEEFTEEDSVVLKILGTSGQPTAKPEEGPRPVQSRTARLTEREVWSLLESALKPAP
ncbi:hypothetical protein T265_09655 [Opisthorchis viverrini]|uniref:DNA helicase n=1 Tax=Opisthorchis viverrini TaxID=6198 RepID=A0A074Z9F6_OPIVI|nr:hypothetical protein T265_09655 [Opisthorchis viverrini]KER22182.1 hypothetical protein T265_09655 [Opisthorchis viverrini]